MKKIYFLLILFFCSCKSWKLTAVNPEIRDFRYMYDIKYLYPYDYYPYDYYYQRNYDLWINYVYTDYYYKKIKRKNK